MSKNFHILRSLQSSERVVAESELLLEPGVVIVLAEPGAGKTALLANFARRFDTKATKASCYFEPSASSCQIVDAFDEVARLGAQDIGQILSKIRATGADRIVLSSRSGEWEKSQTQLVKDVFDIEPVVVQLLPLTEHERRQLFAHELPDENFDDFIVQVQRFDLGLLLGNPEFLKLFAAAYIESGRLFKSRKAVFDDAIKHLAHEANEAISQRGAPTRNQRVAWAEEVFAKVLLSGAVGVSIAGRLQDDTFPNLGDLGIDSIQLPSILDTKLFKPATGEGLHEPIHRIVAEYGAARYLIRLVDDAGHIFSMRQCLSVIAPNGTTRDELRGLLGWMAALGSQSVQNAAIEVDPYAVLGNGDPSMLSENSKLYLLKELQKLQVHDPHFRRSDRWRNFSAAGFFTPSVIQAVRPILLKQNDDDELRMLLLELLEGSPANAELVPELQELIFNEEVPKQVRTRAQMQLGSVTTHNHKPDFDRLVKSGTPDALELAAEICVDAGVENFEADQLALLLRANAQTVPRDFDRLYALKKVTQSLNLEATERLLNELTDKLSCTCKAKDAHDCHCRDSISKTVGSLLDRFFTLAADTADPAKVWGWIKNLNFHNQARSKDSAAVRALQENNCLRQQIQQSAFANVTDEDEIWKIYSNTFGWQGHSGLGFQMADELAMVEIAFETNNLNLWCRFLSGHRYYNKPENRGPNPLRHVMRLHANANPEFMTSWVQRNKIAKRQWQEGRYRRGRFDSRRTRRDRRIAKRNERSLREDKEQIEAGECWRWLSFMASLYLSAPERLSEEFGGKVDVEKSLLSSFTGQAADIPSLDQLGQGAQHRSVQILHAACLLQFRISNDLSAIDQKILKAVKLDIGGYKNLQKTEVVSFEAEVDRCLFCKVEREQYLRDLIEPQLNQNRFIDLSWLDRKVEFQAFRSTLPTEWLALHPTLSYQVLDKLFDMAAMYGDRDTLTGLIRKNCNILFRQIGPFTKVDPRAFWFLRYFYFVDDTKPEIWNWLTADPNNIFALQQHAGRKRHGEETGWPDLTARKIQFVLQSFIGSWPEVHLPSSHGTGSPKTETAYRYLTEVIWTIGRDQPERALPVLDDLRKDSRFKTLDSTLRTIRATVLRTNAHQDWAPPKPGGIVALLEHAEIASVEHMRTLILENLEELQAEIRGSDLDLLDIFYSGDDHLMENASTKRIVTLLRPKLQSLNISDVIEHQMKDAKRCDFTASKMVDGSRQMLVVEVKGQWNPELYTAASAQLFDRYAIHQDAGQQGIYLVLWFGPNGTIAGRKDPAVISAADLYEKIKESVPHDLRGQIDVFVLDLAR
ncbi:hypothetical protein DSW25_12225 [Sulfitobacter donghicola DSW-25 = KCTC 12864 = JCM 14565]|uniref:Uncharacterized protein n=2 Tax=Sulfitobacter TaxID=60136 RepID=A0A073IUE0_9RHOB|nr:hypothetical protein DSW25_12225 [Sulfitobacter donghicola DSW-25 = KCTC 12864 = JCM 14565]